MNHSDPLWKVFGSRARWLAMLWRSAGPPTLRPTAMNWRKRADLAVSIDIFDTILCFALLPNKAVWSDAARSMAALGAISSLEDFVEARTAASRALRRHGRPVVIEEIYLYMSAQLQIDPRQASHLAMMEVAATLNNALVIPGAHVLLAELRERTESGSVVFISDMYLPSPAVRGALIQANLWHQGDSLWISGESGSDKKHGTIFPRIRHAESSMGGRRWLHVGDDPLADNLAPRWHGLSTWPTTQAQPSGAELALARIGGGSGSDLGSWLAGASRFTRLQLSSPDSETRHDRASIAFTTDFFGPLLCLYSLWLLNFSRQREIRVLQFPHGDEIVRRFCTSLSEALGVSVECITEACSAAYELSSACIESCGCRRPDDMRLTALGFHTRIDMEAPLDEGNSVGRAILFPLFGKTIERTSVAMSSHVQSAHAFLPEIHRRTRLFLFGRSLRALRVARYRRTIRASTVHSGIRLYADFMRERVRCEHLNSDLPAAAIEILGTTGAKYHETFSATHA